MHAIRWTTLIVALVLAACSPSNTTDGGADGDAHSADTMGSDVPIDTRRDVVADGSDVMPDVVDVVDVTDVTDVTDVATDVPMPRCGDGALDAGETCDDGNATAGDGCSATCAPETGFQCTGTPSVCTTTCGDGIIAGTEACDDGATTAGDGCSTSCVIEAGWACTGTPSVCTSHCGDGIIAGAEACDDGNMTAGDGCSASCGIEAGFACTGAPSACSTTCGDGVTAGAEACDDGNTTAGDGCSATCAVESGFTCAGTPRVCTATCGDGIRVASEPCDDGNTTSGDGCSATCAVEAGHVCTGSPSVCVTVCGDGIATGTEVCDDGNAVSGDGCSATCGLESGWACMSGSPSVCAPICGDGQRLGAEGCDDSNTAAGDGCSATCTIESGYTCTGAPSTCAATCGDGIVVGAEACDDGNTASSDGCTSTCTIETGFACTGAPSACAAICGDGAIHGTEQCDDGNTANGDCCSATCQIEASVGTLLCEREPNNTSATATGPTTGGGGMIASIGPIGDQDFLAITVTTYTDLRIETFGGLTNTTCATGIDTVIRFYGADGTTQLGTDDDSGIGACSLLDPTVATSVRRLAPGTYYVRVEEFSNDGAIAQYNVRVTSVATCGNGVREGTETCDDANVVAGDGCAASCTTETGYVCAGTPSVCALSCGDGVVNGGDACDDGNRTAGDGCSATCQIEATYTCSGAPSVCTAHEQQCSDVLDNDGDGLTDAADPDCALPAYFPACAAGQSLWIIRGTDTPRAIPDTNATGITSTVPVTATGTIARAAVLFSITHTFDGDIDMFLTPPGVATPLDITSDNGGGGDNYTSTVLDTTCATAVTAGVAPFSGCFRPETTFATLNGTSPTGTWALKVADDASGDLGTLDNWAVVLCTTP